MDVVTIVQANPGFAVVLVTHETDGCKGAVTKPVIAWRITTDGRTTEVWALTPDGEENYNAVQYPNGEVDNWDQRFANLAEWVEWVNDRGGEPSPWVNRKEAAA